MVVGLKNVPMPNSFGVLSRMCWIYLMVSRIFESLLRFNFELFLVDEDNAKIAGLKYRFKFPCKCLSILLGEYRYRTGNYIMLITNRKAARVDLKKLWNINGRNII